MGLTRTAVTVTRFHLVTLGNDMLTEVRQRLTQQVHGQRGGFTDSVWANRRLLLPRWRQALEPARDRFSNVFAGDDTSGKVQVAWLVKEQLQTR